MSFYHLPNPWNPHYAIPRYVMAEPPERGTFTTQWLPRGTIPQLVPDYLAVPQRRGGSLSKPTLAEHSLKGSSLSGSSLHGDTLGATRYELEPLGAASPEDGQRVARELISRMKRLPGPERGPLMKQTLRALDPTLPSRAEKYALDAQRRGMPAALALETGIARAVNESSRARRSSPRSSSLRGLGRSPTSLGAQIKNKQLALGDTAASGDVTMPGIFAEYGRRAAAAVLVRVRSMPTEMRKDALRKILNAIDPNLYNTTQTYAQQYVGKGIDPETAVELAMARAMGAGLASEIVEVGKRGRGARPPVKGQLGLGCYGRAALGQIDKVAILSAGTKTTTAPLLTDIAKFVPPPLSPLKQAAILPSQEQLKTLIPVMYVGGWAFPKDATFAQQRIREKLSPELQAGIKHGLGLGKQIWRWGHQWSRFLDAPPEYVNAEMFQSSAEGSNTTPKEGWNPMLKAKHPVTGEDYGLFFTLEFPSRTKPMNAPDNQPDLIVTWAKIQPAYRKWYEKAWDFIMDIPAKIVDAAKAVLDEVGELACKLLDSDGAKPAAGAVSTYYTGSPAAGTTGVDAGQRACSEPPPPPPPPPPPTGSGYLVPLAVAGGGLLLVLALARRK